MRRFVVLVSLSLLASAARADDRFAVSATFPLGLHVEKKLPFGDGTLPLTLQAGVKEDSALYLSQQHVGMVAGWGLEAAGFYYFGDDALNGFHAGVRVRATRLLGGSLTAVSDASATPDLVPLGAWSGELGALIGGQWVQPFGLVLGVRGGLTYMWLPQRLAAMPIARSGLQIAINLNAGWAF